MFSATKLLGGLMENGLGGGGMLGTAAKVAGVAAAGGVAYGAYRHYKAGGFGQGGPGLFGGSGAAPSGPAFGGQPPGGNPFGASPPAAAGGNPFGGGPAPQGNPWATPAAKTASAPPPEPTREDENAALLLVRAMIAAAYVDGGLDSQERANIVRAAETAGMGAGERQALEHELANPHRVNLLLGEVEDPEMARQVYLVTLLAIDRDSPVERAYVAGLPLYLGLTPADVGAIHQQLGLSG